MIKPKTITLGELKQQLAWLWDLADETEVSFGAGDLNFYRAKTRLYQPDDKTPAIVNIEFNQLYEVTMDPDDNA
ncbi:hypothetical protein AAKU55_005289 [Oxalobacteraceae bacterium GrIS 1.11]